MAQIFLLCMVCEAISFNGKARKNYENPGDYGWDVFNLSTAGGVKNHYRTAEIKNGRLAMCASTLREYFVFPDSTSPCLHSMIRFLLLTVYVSRAPALASQSGYLVTFVVGGAIHHALITNQGLLEQINAGNWLGGTRPF